MHWTVTFSGEVEKTPYGNELTSPGSGCVVEIEDRIRQTAERTLTLRFRHPYPNPEGFAYSYNGFDLTEDIESYGVLDGWRPVEGTWDVSITASEDGWILTALRWVGERPQDSLLDALDRFEVWDEVDDRRVLAARSAVETTPHAATQAGDLSDEEWDELKVGIANTGVDISPYEEAHHNQQQYHSTGDLIAALEEGR